MLTVATFLWHDEQRQRDYSFDIHHVAIWRSMVERNLTIPHELVLITDDPHPIENIGVRTIPIMWEKHVPGSCAVKLMVRNPEVEAALGKRVFLTDLDIVITGNIDALVDRDEPSVFYRNPNWVNDPFCRRSPIQGSLQLFDVDAHPELYEDFDPKTTPRWINRRYGGLEQAWLGERLGFKTPVWTQDDGVYGAGRLFDGTWDEGIGHELPENAKIVVFPGNREPSQQAMRERFPWLQEHYH